MFSFKAFAFKEKRIKSVLKSTLFFAYILLFANIKPTNQINMRSKELL